MMQYDFMLNVALTKPLKASPLTAQAEMKA